ncbi:MAG: CopD family protein [Gammaproteobacteria bacterium]|nr:CopD family protein [Gammaproteobacteria bacterium]
MALAITLHLLAAIVWIGGMFFAYMALRPAAARVLEPPPRLHLWQLTFKRFFVWVWVCVLVLPLTGYWMVFFVLDGFGQAALYIHIMHFLGLVMIAIYMFVYFRPYQGLKDAIRAEDFPLAASHLNKMRQLIAINLSLGIATVLVASMGRYF